MKAKIMFPKIRMLWLGSDPEYLYYHPEREHAMDLSELVANTREQRMKCFIGTDGHAMNAEIRPAPCRNIYLHLARVADAIYQIQQRLDSWGDRAKDFRGVALLASPEYNREVMGGHVHLSFFVRDPALCNVVLHGAVPYTVANAGSLWYSQRVPHISEAIAAHANYIAQGGGFTIERMVQKIRYLGEPFEEAMFAPHNHRRKNAEVVREPIYRMADVPTAQEKRLFNDALKRQEVYLRFEWRQPSTWLRDPHLAYCYLALVKFAALNTHIIPAPFKNREGESPKDAFERRLEKLFALGARLTPDLRAFPTRVFDVLATRDRPHPWLVNYDAWNRYRAT